MDLQQQLLHERLSSYARLRGGFPVPLAGAIWWAGLAAYGWTKPHTEMWIIVAFVTSGIIFPMALLLSKIFNNNFMKDKTAVTSVLFPTFISMLIFWPMAISALWNYPPLVPLILAIGMSIHWPVIGWSYGRPALFSAHAIARAVGCFILWNYFPEQRFIGLPALVSVIYLITVIAIFIDSAAVKARLAKAGAA